MEDKAPGMGTALRLRWLIGLVVVLGACPVSAHEMRPGYLEVREIASYR